MEHNLLQSMTDHLVETYFHSKKEMAQKIGISYLK